MLEVRDWTASRFSAAALPTKWPVKAAQKWSKLRQRVDPNGNKLAEAQLQQDLHEHLPKKKSNQEHNQVVNKTLMLWYFLRSAYRVKTLMEEKFKGQYHVLFTYKSSELTHTIASAFSLQKTGKTREKY